MIDIIRNVSVNNKIFNNILLEEEVEKEVDDKIIIIKNYSDKSFVIIANNKTHELKKSFNQNNSKYNRNLSFMLDGKTYIFGGFIFFKNKDKVMKLLSDIPHVEISKENITLKLLDDNKIKYTEKSNSGKITLQKYSDKSYILYGQDTIAIKDDLKKYGKFNRSLNVDNRTIPGWVFPNDKIHSLREFLDNKEIYYDDLSSE